MKAEIKEDLLKPVKGVQVVFGDENKKGAYKISFKDGSSVEMTRSEVLEAVRADKVADCNVPVLSFFFSHF